ncbi:MAG: carboxylate--amine ligase [Phycisphaerales bacterium]|nr:MAG: carboxylate--amine ligase [Phycisphaerales bacterium]
MLGESKSQILDGLNDTAEHVLPARLVEAGPPPEQRACNAARIIGGEPELCGYPIVLKPDAGERGYGVAIIRSSNELEPYFRRIQGPVLCQKYHPGPCEFGVFWIRKTDAIDDEEPTPAGRIYSVTRKRFPLIEGDGVHTLEELIFRDNRFRKQSKLMLRRHRDRLGWVPSEGETVRLGHAGNHAQGAIFSDGGDLVTPELSAKIDEIARSFRGDGDGELDFGRFDLRCPSEDDLRAGRNLAIIEVNGVFSESTNLYDPDRSALWAYRVLLGQWKRLYEVGAARKRAGRTPIGAAELARTIIEHRRSQRTPWSGG